MVVMEDGAQTTISGPLYTVAGSRFLTVEQVT